MAGKFSPAAIGAGQDADTSPPARQVWEAGIGSDLLVLREVLTRAEMDPRAAAVVLAALYEQSTDPELEAILTRAEETPLTSAAELEAG